MYNAVDKETYQKAGDYNLSKVELVSYTGERIVITKLIAEINIYENLFSNGLSGNIVVTDSLNLPFEFPISGFEKVCFKLSSPGFDDLKGRHYDFTEESGHPMYIYKISDRQEGNQKTQVYVLNFCSREVIRNEQVRVSRAFEGGITNMILELMRDKNYLDCKKPIFFEEDKINTKWVCPNLHPMGAIRRLADKTESLKYKNAGFLFYEDAGGYKFRSLEACLAESPEIGRKVQAKYNYFTSNILIDNKDKDVIQELQLCQRYKILTGQDTIKAIKSGVAASKLLTHDSFNKVFAEHDFDYHKEYAKSHHTENRDPKTREKQDTKFILPLTPYDRDKEVSLMPDSINFFASATAKIHNDTETPPAKDILQKRISQRNAFDTSKAEIDVPGFTGVSVGEIVALNVPSISLQEGRNDYSLDKYLTGRYLLSQIKHTVNRTIDKHTMTLELIKDSPMEGFPENATDNFTGKEAQQDGEYIDQYTLDESISG